MSLASSLCERWPDPDLPFLIRGERELCLSDLQSTVHNQIAAVRAGDVVALVGDFEPQDIATFLALADIGAIIVPLTEETAVDHAYFCEAASVDIFIDGKGLRRLRAQHSPHPLLAKLRASGYAGLVLFSSGTTGRPKAVLHDFSVFLKRFEVPRPTLKTLNFLLFDHIGGINTLLHTLFNRGLVVAPKERTIGSIFDTISEHQIELLPTTPTFLRMSLMSGKLGDGRLGSLKVVTYGTERMDQPTLDLVCAELPHVDFRQTFGMSELGIVRVKSRARDSLFMKIGGDGVETKVVDAVLKLRSQQRMLGYLNAPSPFDDEGWYDTKDVVEVEGEYLRIVGRTNEMLNIGGLKGLPSEIERVALIYPGISQAKAFGRPNPITGQHVELVIETLPDTVVDETALRGHFAEHLPAHLVPRRIRREQVAIGHRFKKL